MYNGFVGGNGVHFIPRPEDVLHVQNGHNIENDFRPGCEMCIKKAQKAIINRWA